MAKIQVYVIFSGMADISRQRFVIARFADFCDHHNNLFNGIDDPTLYLWEKLTEIEEPLYQLKQDLLKDAINSFVARSDAGRVKEDKLLELRHLLDRLLSRGDYADASYHLSADVMSDPKRMEFAQSFLSDLKAQNLLLEERKPLSERDPGWDKLVQEMYGRLGLDLLETCVRRHPLDGRRTRYILRRLRRNTADYCAVLHVPLNDGDTFTPFILPRVEAVVAADRRFLRRVRLT